MLRTKKAIYGNEQILIAADGQQIPIIVNAAPILDEASDVEQVVFVFEDISQLKQAEEALRTERNFLQNVMDTMPSGIVVLNPQGDIITFANAHAEKILGIQRDAITQQINSVVDWTVTYLDGQVMPPEKQISSRIKISRKPILGVEQLITTAAGQEIPLRVNAVPYLDNEGHLQQILYSFEDISLQLRWQQQIEEALAQEKELHELKNRFVTLISHELRTPLSIIMTSTELIQRNFEKMTPLQIVRRTDKIQKQVMRLKRIMEDVSFINKTDRVGHQIQLTVIDLPTFCKNIVEGVLLVEENKPQIIKQYEGSVTDIVGDETLLYQIMVNLVSNAVKYTPEDRTVIVSCQVTNVAITFCVADDGIGIPEADQAKLFQSFHRASNVSNIQGTGLGLDIVRRAVNVLEGSVSFTSQEGEGTTFTVILPNLAQKD
ncbi:MAG: PAS domain-containing sensor histidine kinase [Anaerolineae bacterium]|nr:PAS domain-containing sensor histidine kinase [Anaerolineae bacterium]